MSYRDDRAAATRRIAALEARLEEQGADLSDLREAMATRAGDLERLEAKLPRGGTRWRWVAAGTTLVAVGALVAGEARVRAAERRAQTAQTYSDACAEDVALLADPVDVQVAEQNRQPEQLRITELEEGAADGSPTPELDDPWREADPYDPLTGEKDMRQRLLQRVADRTATRADLYELRAVCKSLRDHTCEELAAVALQREYPGAWDEAMEKRVLRAKLDLGTATQTELRLLKALCMHAEDRACREAAAEALRLLPTH